MNYDFNSKGIQDIDLGPYVFQAPDYYARGVEGGETVVLYRGQRAVGVTRISAVILDGKHDGEQINLDRIYEERPEALPLNLGKRQCAWEKKELPQRPQDGIFYAAGGLPTDLLPEDYSEEPMVMRFWYFFIGSCFFTVSHRTFSCLEEHEMVEDEIEIVEAMIESGRRRN